MDYARRRALLSQAQDLAVQPERGAALRTLLGQAADGRAKFWAVWRALQLRREHEAMLARADTCCSTRAASARGTSSPLRGATARNA